MQFNIIFKTYLNIFIRYFVLCIQIRFVSTEKNYSHRLVCILFSKVFERIVYDYLLDFICTNNILSDYQFGFRPGHSTQQAIITLIDKITKSLDNGDIVISLFIDLK